MTPDRYWQDSLQFRAKAEAVVNDPELRASYLAVADAYAIPSTLRGYAAVALQYGFISLDGSYFNPSRGITRLELAKGMNAVVNR